MRLYFFMSQKDIHIYIQTFTFCSLTYKYIVCILAFVLFSSKHILGLTTSQFTLLLILIFIHKLITYEIKESIIYIYVIK